MAPRRKPVEAEGADRLQKILAHAGVGSRRACEDMILQGRVSVAGKIIRELGTKVDPTQMSIAVDGQKVTAERLVYYAVYKPKGYVSTNNDPSGRPRVLDILPEIPQRVYTVGRLDEMSVGLMLLTNDGELANKLAHPKFGVEKLYRVEVAGFPTQEVLRQLTDGIWLAEGKVRAKRVRAISRKGEATILEMVLAEGKNREVRRMLAKLGHKVMRLTRVAVGPITVKGLNAGMFRTLTGKEIDLLRRCAAGESVPMPWNPDFKPRPLPDRPQRAEGAGQAEGSRPGFSSGPGPRDFDRPRPERPGQDGPRRFDGPRPGQNDRSERRPEGFRPNNQDRPERRPEGYRPNHQNGAPQRSEGYRPNQDGPPRRPEGFRPNNQDRPERRPEGFRPNHQNGPPQRSEGYRPNQDGPPRRPEGFRPNNQDRPEGFRPNNQDRPEGFRPNNQDRPERRSEGFRPNNQERPERRPDGFRPNQDGPPRRPDQRSGPQSQGQGGRPQSSNGGPRMNNEGNGGGRPSNRPQNGERQGPRPPAPVRRSNRPMPTEDRGRKVIGMNTAHEPVPTPTSTPQPISERDDRPTPRMKRPLGKKPMPRPSSAPRPMPQAKRKRRPGDDSE